MRVLVCGGRGFNDWDQLSEVFTNLWPMPTIIIQDGESAAAELSGRWTRQNGLVLETYSADWKNNGVLAGKVRNQRMLDEGRPDLVVAFGANHQTNHLVGGARARGIEVLEVTSREYAEVAPDGNEASARPS